MSGLYGSLSVALSSLLASQQAMETSTNNVANANTPGYSRQRPDMVPGDPIVEGNLSFGTGVVLQRIESLRDPILEIQLNQATQQQSKLNTSLGALQQMQTMFSSASTGIGADITNFFTSLQQLSPDPSSVSLRQAVLTAAGNLATDFNTTAGNLQMQRSNLDLNVVQTVGEINTLTAQIASVSHQIVSLENLHQNAGSLVDKQTSLIRQLSGLMDVSVIQTEHGIALTTSDGTPLVSGGESFDLTNQTGNGGLQRILAGSQDITGSLTGGTLAGLIQIRDQEIPSIGSSLDQLAAGLANALNTANRSGYDLNGDAGVNLFAPPPAGGVGAAAALSVNLTDPALVAASSDGTPGSNGNLAALLAVHDQAVVAGQKPLDFYSNLVFKIGSDTSNASADVDASDQILRQLQDQRSSISAVSLDEEAANMVKYQTAYQAAARVVTTVNSMLDAAVNLGRY
ncbi:MAG TPA: flagellar hook-associated protein FlgK [Terriglobales bacterium]|nr:flagellar hook-associated protein FlgK [Terriglobales bacterium]